MKNLKLFWKIARLGKIDKIITVFIITTFVIAFLLYLIEPGINSFGEGVYFSFVSFLTVGFGDIVPVTFLGRLLTIILTIFGVMVVALITGVLVTYYKEIIERRSKDTMNNLMDKLENLPNLSKEELTAISEKVKEKRWGLKK